MNTLKILNVGNGTSDYPGNFTKEEIKIIRKNIIGRCLHLFSGKSDLGDVRVDYSYGNVKEDVFAFLEINREKFRTVILDAPYNTKFADKYKKIGSTPEQFVIFANTRGTGILFKHIIKLNPEIIILKSRHYYIIKGYELLEGYCCYAGGYRKPTILLIMRKKYKTF